MIPATRRRSTVRAAGGERRGVARQGRSRAQVFVVSKIYWVLTDVPKTSRDTRQEPRLGLLHAELAERARATSASDVIKLREKNCGHLINLVFIPVLACSP
jgi:hypothetical protein